MSASSNDNGRAYEYAWMQILGKALAGVRPFNIINNSSLEANKKAWNTLTEDDQRLYLRSAEAAVNTILEMEPLMLEDDGDILTLEFQTDENGIKGDVRDIVVKRDLVDYEAGLSIKHNHEAVKHSRLSHKLDFGKEWYEHPCSAEYWKEIKPVFDRLIVEKSKGSVWNKMADKDTTVYVPLLQAFINEVLRAYKADSSLPRKMVEYLIGVKDYYKVVSKDSSMLTLIHTFNMHKTLNKPSKTKVSAITVPVVDLPTRLVALEFKPGSTNTIEMYLNNGWQLKFRLHNASTTVQPSLKFDVQFMGTPSTILNIECKWHTK